MKAKTVSILILGFCILSIVIGVLSAAKQQEIKKACPAPPPPSIFKGFKVTTGDKIALVSMEGIIAQSGSDSFFRDFSSAGSALKSLNKAYEDKSVKGVIFRVDSPGGTVAMSQEIHNSLLRLREKKPVFVSMADVAASGGYFVASAADRIYANPGTVTGSIGVIMETMDASGLLTDKLGVKSEIIKSGKYKDIGNIYRALSPDERVLLNNLVNNAYGQFLQAITAGRMTRVDEYDIEKVELSEASLKQYADGRVFTGEQALEYGFVDKLGGLYVVEEDIKKVLGKKDIQVVDYNKPRGFEEFFLQISDRFTPDMRGVQHLIPLSRKYPRQPLFIWE